VTEVAVDSFECRVDEEEFAACDSPHRTAALGDGPHVFDDRDQRRPTAPATRATRGG